MSKEKIKRLRATTEERGGELVAIASTEDVDRVGDSLKVSDWDFKNFQNNPVLQAGHNYLPQHTIGVAEDLKIEGKIVTFKPKFHNITPLAKQIGEMYKKKILKAWSVGFIPGEEDGQKNELLEVSAVAIPANPHSLTAYKGLLDNAEKYDEQVVDSVKDWVKSEIDDKDAEEVGAVNKDQEFVETQFGLLRESVDVVERRVIQRVYGSDNDGTDEDNQDEEKDFGHRPSKKSESNYRERWNRSLSKAFDITNVPSRPASFELDIFRKFLGCKVKDIFLNYFEVPSPLLGSYLGGFKELLKDYELQDTRNFTYGGGEVPSMREVIQLNSEKSEDFLINGTEFYAKDDKNKLIVKYRPEWFGMTVTIVSHNNNRDENKDLLESTHKWVKENYYLKGEKFSLSGEFIEKTEDSWEDVILKQGVEDSLKKAVSNLNKKGKDAKARGILMVGYPGTGKTKSGRVMMNESDATFVWVSARDFNEYTPVRTLKLAFKLANDLGPSVLFLEDIDMWLKNFTIDLLKTEMDGLRESKGMITILTSNNPEELPDALLDRPGRFHDVLDFELPDSGLRQKMVLKWAGEIDKELLEKIISETEGYSGAHMKELVEFAELIVEDDGLTMGEALIKSLEKLKAQRELVKRIRNRETVEVEEKKNDDDEKEEEDAGAGVIKNIVTLEKRSKDTPKELKGDEKGRERRVVHKSKKKVVKKKIDDDEIIARAVKTIARASNLVGHIIKKKGNIK